MTMIFLSILLASLNSIAQVVNFPLAEYKGVLPVIEIQMNSLNISFRSNSGEEISRHSLLLTPSNLQITDVPEDQKDVLRAIPPALDPNFDMDTFMRSTAEGILEARANGLNPLSVNLNQADPLVWPVRLGVQTRYFSFYQSDSSYVTFYNAYGAHEFLQIKVTRPEGRTWRGQAFKSYDPDKGINFFGYPSEQGYQLYFIYHGQVFSGLTSVRSPLVASFFRFDNMSSFKFDSKGVLTSAILKDPSTGELMDSLNLAPVEPEFVNDLMPIVKEAVSANKSLASNQRVTDASELLKEQNPGDQTDTISESDLEFIMREWIELEEVDEVINTGGSPEGIKDILSGILQELSIAQARERRLDIADSVAHIVEPFAVNLMKDEINGVDLVGLPGVGKTWTAKALAHEFFWNSDIPMNLRKTQFFALSASAFTATDGIVGRIEKRAYALIELAKLYPNLVFVIDEIHSLKGAGVSIGNDFDVWNFLKPHMADGTLKIVGMGTEKELDIAYSDDPALRDRRPRIEVTEPSIEKMPNILNNWLIGHGYSGTLGEGVGAELARLAQRMSSVGANPRRSTTLLDHIMATRKFRGVSREELTSFSINELYGYAADFYGADPALFTREALVKRIENFNELFDQNVVGLKHVKEIMERKLISHFLPRRSGVSVPGQLLLFAGPPGSGKTHSSKVLALTMSGKNSVDELVEGRDYGLLKGANYSSIDDVDRFLTDIAQIVSINKFAVITVDEIDRAHPKVQDTLLSILTEGIVEPSNRNSFGNKTTQVVDVSLSQFVFTTNQGEDYVQKVGIKGFDKSAFSKTAFGIVPALVDRLTVVPVPNANIDQMAEILKMTVEQTLASFESEFGLSVGVSDLDSFVERIILRATVEESDASANFFGMGASSEGSEKSDVVISARQQDAIELLLIDPVNRYILSSQDVSGKKITFDVDSGSIFEGVEPQINFQCKKILK